jgi:hypothetical protein
MQVRLLVPGAETVLGDAAADAELFVTDEYDEVRLTPCRHCVLFVSTFLTLNWQQLDCGDH